LGFNGRSQQGSGRWVAMLLENFPYPQDPRVRAEAQALVRAGYRVTVVAPRAHGQPRREVVEGVEVDRFRLPPDRPDALSLLVEYAIAHLALIRRAVSLLRRGVDVVHVHNPPDTMFVALALARRIRRRTVFDNHDLMTDLFELKFGGGLPLTIVRWAQRQAFLTPHLVITSNESQREAAIAAGRPAEDVVVVRTAPARATLCDPADAVAPSRKSGEPFTALYLGMLGPQDGVDRLPDVLHRLRGEHALEVELLVVGDGPARPAMEARARELGVDGHLRVTGLVDHAALPDYVAGADICLDVAPCNRFNDRCTMNKVIHYLAGGRPVVSFPLFETQRTAGDTIRFARPNDLDDFARQVAELLREPEARTHMARHGRALAETLVWEHSEPDLLAAYQALLGERMLQLEDLRASGELVGLPS
jgi:glycosyltransferase involved in cell wall biosynthesis